MNNLTQRILTALVLIAVLLTLLFKASPLVFTGAAFIFGALAVWELWRLVQFQKRTALWVMLLVYGACALQLWVLQWPWLLWSFGIIHACMSAWVLWKKPQLAGLGTGVYGSVLLACMVYAMVVLQGLGAWVLITAMIVVWAADVGGYFFGKSIGGRLIAHGLAPSVSPKKSWEGAIGGVLLACVVSIILALSTSATTGLQSWVIAGVRVSDYLMDNALSVRFLLEMLIPTVVVAAYSVTGDLVESLLKRQAGVKDSSQLLPGHGGILDRIDALIPVLPLCAAWAVAVKAGAFVQ